MTTLRSRISFRRQLPSSQRQTNPVPEGASRGQVVIMFAIFATVMFGILGLAIDLGFSFAERRTIQNSADLAAVAGARAIVRYKDTDTVKISALTDINAVVSGNQMADATPTLETDSCQYVDYSGVSQGPCNLAVPASATGITLTVQETHDTFFMRMFPGAPSHLTVKATARAYVERTQNAGFDSPIIVCGYGSKLTNGTALNILSNNTTINPDAIGQTFRLTGTSQGATPQIGNCGISGNSTWRGAASQYDNTYPALKEVNDYWILKAGTTPPSVARAVAGIEGCTALKAQPYGGCIVMIPVACGTAQGCAGPTGTVGNAATPLKVYVVKILAFRVQTCGTSCISGTLLDDYLISEMTYPGGGGWCRDCGGVVGIKLDD